MWSYVLTFIKLGLFLLAIGLSIANINERFNSNKTTSTSHIADLAIMDFPLKISVLINPGFKFKELERVGYWEGHYFSGVSKYNDSHIGWAGHTPKGGNAGNMTGMIPYAMGKKHRNLLYCL